MGTNNSALFIKAFKYFMVHTFILVTQSYVSCLLERKKTQWNKVQSFTFQKSISFSNPMTSPRNMETDFPNQQIRWYKSTQRIKQQQNETKLLPKLSGRGHQKELEKLPCLEAGSSHVPWYIVNANSTCVSHSISFYWCYTAHVYCKRNKGKLFWPGLSNADWSHIPEANSDKSLSSVGND
jgi:hypothetical protein